MTSVNVTELRQHLPEYLKQVQAGEAIAITLHGKTIAHIIPDHTKANVRQRLIIWTLRGTVIVGDILAPLDEKWVGDADNL